MRRTELYLGALLYPVNEISNLYLNLPFNAPPVKIAYNLIFKNKQKTQIENCLSIFSKIFKQDTKKFHNKEPLSASRLNIPCNNPAKINCIDEFKKELQKEWNNLQNAIKNTDLYYNKPFIKLLHLIEKYFFFYPLQYSSLESVSIFEASKLLSSLALAIFDQYGADESVLNEIESNPEKDVCLIIAGDISGVQNFIFDIPSKGAAKSLRGRSLYLDLLCEFIAKFILKNLNLPISNLLYCGGANFQMIAGLKDEDRLKDLKKQIHEILWDVHRGEIYIAIAWEKLNAMDISQPDKLNEKYKILFSKVNRDKNRKFKDILPKIFNSVEIKGKPCKICNFREAKEENGICEYCESFQQLTDELKTAKYFYEKECNNVEAQNYKMIFEKLGFDIGFAENKGPDGIYYEINDTKMDVDGFKFIPLNLPMTNNNIKDFDEIAQGSEGIKALGILKCDVDNLGKIFSKGIKDATFLERMRLSNMMHLFFSLYFPKLIRENKGYSENIYLVFSGGDDTLLFGAWDKVYNLLCEMRHTFKEFVAKNKYVTMSGSYTIIDEKFPVIRAVKIAEERLEKAKGKKKIKKVNGVSIEMKNNINVMGEIFNSDEFMYLNEIKDELEKLSDIESKEDALRICRKIIKATKGFGALLEDSLHNKINVKKVWRFAYYLRHEAKKKNIKDSIEKLVKINQDIIIRNMIEDMKVENKHLLAVAARLVDFKLRRREP